MGNKNWIFLLGMTVASCMPFVASANLVLNGSFEVPTPNPVSFQTVNAGDPTIADWTVVSGSVDLIGNYWQAANGVQSVDMSGNANGTISQTINLAAGTYNLTFAESGNPDGPPVLKQLLVSLGGGPAQEFDYTSGGNTHAAMDYTTQTATFTLLSSGPVALVFQDISNPGSGYSNPGGGPLGTTPYGAVLDNVVLTAVPEPTTLISGACLLLPFGASALRILRRNKSA